MYNKILKNPKYIKANNTIAKLEENRLFCRHDIAHSLDVARIAYIINLEDKLGINKNKIYAAALLHDIGRCDTSAEHNISSYKMANIILQECSYSDEDIADILQAIINHRITNNNITNLTELISYADKVARQCYSCHAYAKCYWQDSKKNKVIVY